MEKLNEDVRDVLLYVYESEGDDFSENPSKNHV